MDDLYTPEELLTAVAQLFPKELRIAALELENAKLKQQEAQPDPQDGPKLEVVDAETD